MTVTGRIRRTEIPNGTQETITFHEQDTPLLTMHQYYFTGEETTILSWPGNGSATYRESADTDPRLIGAGCRAHCTFPGIDTEETYIGLLEHIVEDRRVQQYCDTFTAENPGYRFHWRENGQRPEQYTLQMDDYDRASTRHHLEGTTEVTAERIAALLDGVEHGLQYREDATVHIKA